MTVRSWLSTALLALLISPACGGEEEPPPSDPVPVAGSYSFFLTYGENGCGFGNWPRGEDLLNVAVEVTQIGANAVATPDGDVGLFLDEQAGTRAFAGTIEETTLELRLEGELFFLEGNCTFHYDGALVAEAIGDFLTGEIRYIGATNNNPGCEAIEGCVSRQAFNATKPPGDGVVVLPTDAGM